MNSNRLVIFGGLILLFSVCNIGGISAQDTEVEMEDILEKNEIEGISRLFLIHSPLGLPEMQSYKSLNFSTEIKIVEEYRAEIVNTLADKMPSPQDPFPLEEIPGTLDQRYLNPSPKIESENPRISALAQEILSKLDQPNAKEVVFEVLRWNRSHLIWGNPNDVPSAIESLDTRTVNCIGFTHLPAAILRQLGIPARTVRTFIARPDQNRLIPHYLLEVYYPSLDGWITYEPQGPGMPFIENIVLYTHYDWDIEGQRNFRWLARDLNKTVLGGIDPSIENPDLSPPELLDIAFDPPHFDPKEGHKNVQVTIIAKDENTGIEEIRMDMQSPNYAGPGKTLLFSLDKGNAKEGVFKAPLGWNLQTENIANEYRVTRLRMTDSLGNIREYQLRNLEDMDLATGVTLARWPAVDKFMPEPVYISPFFPERVPAAPDGLHYTFFYAVSKTQSEASGGISTIMDFVHQDGVQVRANGLGNFRVGDYYFAFNTLQYVPPHHPYGRYQMNSLYLRGPNNLSYNILPRNFNQEIMDYGFELVKDVPLYSGPVQIESILMITDEEDYFTSNRGVILIEASGGIKPLNDKPRDTEPAFRVFFETLDGEKLGTRRSICNRRFGSHHLLFRPNGPRDTPVRVERIELDDKEGNTKVFYRKDFQDKILKTIPEYITLD
ncbi:transglutaminase superfamily protein [Mongoliibacter ruber]|uniref:Transglutaminase superfamily protein n=1 Tax=Mongoliibacter ruber TaxID=1750599 RepID=A0A2T0WHR4_9BACT|nr:transglutaminase superfamily protein [Mongoliibacter ruber]